MAEVFEVDGWNLSAAISGTPIRGIELRDGLYGTPAPVGSNGTVTNLTGELWRAKKHGPGGFTLNVWTTPSSGGIAALDALWDDMIRAFGHTSRLLTVRRTMWSGEVRVCRAELVSGMSPSAIGIAGYRCGLEMRIPSGYWVSPTPVTQVGTPSNAANRTLSLAAFNGATAPLEDLTVTIQGGITEPYVRDTTDLDLESEGGDWFRYYGTIPEDAALIVNCADWTVSQSGGATSGFVAEIGRLTHSGGRFLTVEHARPGRLSTVQMTGTNVTSAAALTLTGRKFFQA